ncbi:MAG TPA: hypothetical protein VGJ00_08080 [Rhabdochlamydiaceae bacterium]|jgi:hypothetical protein
MEDTINQLRARVAALESQVDLLEAEQVHLQEMLVHCGFPEGIRTLKATIEEYLEEETAFMQSKRRETI